jgi:hypothetical protein
VLPVDKPGPHYGEFANCAAHAYSVFADVDELVAVRSVSKWARKQAIIRVDLAPDMGMINHSPSSMGDSHHDWWPSDLDVVPPHKVIEERPT